MEEYEVAYLEAVVDNLSASIASSMRDGVDDEPMVESDDQLTRAGRMWLRGYLTGRLAVHRAGVVGNPNLNESDLQRVSELADGREAAVAAELYS